MPEIIAQLYELKKEIGSGGGGIVYLGHHIRLNKKIVLKADRRTLKTKEKSLRREVDLLKELSHSYIPQVYDFVQENGVVYTVMDYIEGESLDKLLERHQIPTQPMMIAWACQLLEALCYLHSRPPYGILHGDIKPSNIMLRPNGDICLIDFNIALALGEDGAVKVGSSRGYASPEHYGTDYSHLENTEKTHRNTLRNQKKSNSVSDETMTDADDATLTATDDGVTLTDERSSSSLSERKTVMLDVRSDIYSLGATLYHLISGRRPVMNAVEVEPLGEDVCSPAVSAILQKAMQPNPAHRYQSAQEMLDAFRQIHKRDIRTVRHKRYAICSNFVLILMFLLGGTISFVGLKQMEQRQNALALAEYSANALAEGDVSAAVSKAMQAIPGEGIMEPEVTAEAQKALTDALGVYELSDGFHALDMLQLPSAPFYMTAAPEGDYLAVIYAYEMAVYHMETQETAVVLPVRESALSECVFIDNYRVLYAGKDGLTAYDLDEQKEIWCGEYATALTLSADGRRVAAVDRDAEKALVYDTETGDKITECSFDGNHLTVVENDIFANPQNDIFELNQDGTMLAVSFSNGGVMIFDLDTPEESMILYEQSDFVNFKGGFSKKYFVYTAQGSNFAVFGLINAEDGIILGESESQIALHVKADANGIYLANESLLVRFDPETMEETELAYLTDKKIVDFSVEEDYVLLSSDDHCFSFYDSGAQLMYEERGNENWDFVTAANDFAVIGSRNTPSIRIMRRESYEEAKIMNYDPRCLHEEARISGDGETVMLFNYQNFSIYDMKGNLIAQSEIPYAESVYDQQFCKTEKESYLEVIWYDGTIRCYSASDGSILTETKKEPPDRKLDEEFLTDKYRIKSSLHTAPRVYEKETGKELAVLETDAYLTYVTAFGEYLITEYISTEGKRFGLLLNERFETLAYLPDLCDVSGSRLIFDDQTGNLRQSRLYSLEELKSLGKEYIASH